MDPENPDTQLPAADPADDATRSNSVNVVAGPPAANIVTERVLRAQRLGHTSASGRPLTCRGSSTDPQTAGERLEFLVTEYRGAVFAYARQLTRGDDGWAEDVLQETFLRAWQHSERLTPEYGSVRGWLMRVAHNLVMDGYRSARMRHDESLDVAGDIALPEPTGQILSVHVVRQALALLPEVHQRALEATYLKDQTTIQAARQLNVPVGTVKSRVFYGLRMLRSIMRVDLPSAA